MFASDVQSFEANNLLYSLSVCTFCLLYVYVLYDSELQKGDGFQMTPGSEFASL